MVKTNGADYEFGCERPENFEFGFYVLAKKEGNRLHLMLDKRKEASNQILVSGYSIASLNEGYVNGNKQHYPRLTDKLLKGDPQLGGGAYCFANDTMFITTDREGFWCPQMNREVVERCLHDMRGLERPIRVVFDMGQFSNQPADEFLRSVTYGKSMAYDAGASSEAVPIRI